MAEQTQTPFSRMMRGVPPIEGWQMVHQALMGLLRENGMPKAGVFGPQLNPNDYPEAEPRQSVMRTDAGPAQPKTTTDALLRLLSNLQGPGTAY